MLTDPSQNLGRSLHIRWLAIAVMVVAASVLLSGLLGVVLPAFGIFPVLGRTEPSLLFLKSALSVPGVWRAMLLSLGTGLLSTALACVATLLLLAALTRHARFNRLLEFAAPLLAVPHAAAAFGIAFVIAPSGWAVRLFANLAGFDRPPDVVILNDPFGLSLVLGLAAKEIPFLLLMAVAALSQTRPAQSARIFSSLGYDHVTGWLKVIAPQVYHRIRLPIFAVLCFSVSVVDVALILGPSTPPTLSVLITRFMSAPDLSERLVGSALAVIQFGVLLIAFLAWLSLERLSSLFLKKWINSGRRHGAQRLVNAAVIFVFGLMSVLAVGIVSLVVWSFAGFWSFPDLWPDQLTAKNWTRFGPEALAVLGPTLAVATVSSAVSYGLALLLLNGAQKFLGFIYLALLLPQVVFLPGIANLMLTMDIGASFWAVVSVHILFVLPYMVLALYGPFNGIDPRYRSIALGLGVHPFRVFLTVTLPMLLGPSLAALAIGFAVSVAQYLPTLLIGAGRVVTITTEAVALASGGDRRVIGLYGLVQTLAAVLPFGVAIILPAVIWRNRKGMQNG